MNDRTERLAVTIEQKNEEMLDLLAGLESSDLDRPCADPGGSTVGAVVAHLAEGYGLVLGWIARTTGQETDGQRADASPAPQTHDHTLHHGEPERDVVEHIAQLRAGGAVWAALIRGLADDQLERVPAATPMITDGTQTLADIMEMMVEHQSAHLTYIKEAVADPAVPSRSAI